MGDQQRLSLVPWIFSRSLGLETSVLCLGLRKRAHRTGDHACFLWVPCALHKRSIALLEVTG